MALKNKLYNMLPTFLFIIVFSTRYVYFHRNFKNLIAVIKLVLKTTLCQNQFMKLHNLLV